MIPQRKRGQREFDFNDLLKTAAPSPQISHAEDKPSILTIKPLPVATSSEEYRYVLSVRGEDHIERDLRGKRHTLQFFPLDIFRFVILVSLSPSVRDILT